MMCSNANFAHAKQMSGLESLYLLSLCKQLVSLPHLLITVADYSKIFLLLLKASFEIIERFFKEHPLNNTVILSRDL